jgi:hypothetical protein
MPLMPIETAYLMLGSSFCITLQPNYAATTTTIIIIISKPYN